jgi:hypothetical protein
MQPVVIPEGRVVLLKDDGTWTYATSAGSMFERLRALPVPSTIVDAVRGLFGAVGIRVLDTGETFTCIQRVDGIEFTSGIDDVSVDLTVPVYEFQLARLAACIASGTLDDLEQFRIVRALFATATGRRHILSNPLMSNPVLRRIIRGKNVLHVSLVSPDRRQEPDADCTIIFVNKEHLVVPGLHGTPGRTLRVRVTEAIELQRQIAAGMRSGDLAAWIKIARWYVDWRARVEVRP